MRYLIAIFVVVSLLALAEARRGKARTCAKTCKEERKEVGKCIRQNCSCSAADENKRQCIKECKNTTCLDQLNGFKNCKQECKGSGSTGTGGTGPNKAGKGGGKVMLARCIETHCVDDCIEGRQSRSHKCRQCLKKNCKKGKRTPLTKP